MEAGEGEIMAIVKAVKVKLAAGRIAEFQCPKDKTRAYLWCDEVKGLGIIATAAGAKSYFFQAKVKGKSMRLTMGDVGAWSIADAQKEARRLQTVIDQGDDPREVKADKEAAKVAVRQAKEAEAAALGLQATRESVTLGMAWPEYVAARKPLWSAVHLRDHEKVMQAGGDIRKRSHKLTEPGNLASLAAVRLIDLTPELVTEWAKVEAVTRPTRARLALRLLRAFLFWCARHPTYKAIVTSNAAQSKDARESLGKPKAKHDVLQREQLPAWFAAVKQLDNPVISAYLQALLLTGARRNELAALKWDDVDFKWHSLTMHDKVEGLRVIPLTPYVESLLLDLKRHNDTPPNVKKLNALKVAGKEWEPSLFVFSSPTAAKGCIHDPSIAHRRACAVAGLDMTLHGLRRSFATLCEWTETPAGIAAQIQGHAPQGVREQNYIRRPLDLLRMWHVKIEAWILEQAEIEFVPVQAGLRVVAGSAA
jgi:integrase